MIREGQRFYMNTIVVVVVLSELPLKERKKRLKKLLKEVSWPEPKPAPISESLVS